MSFEHCLSNKELQAIIEGRRMYRKCPTCSGKGYEYYCGNTGHVFPDQGLHEDEYNDLSDNVGTEQCDTCKGLGYVVAVYE